MPCAAVRPARPRPQLAVGDQVMHASFGVGEITHTFGSGEKVSIAVKFAGMGAKILDPRLAPIEPVKGQTEPGTHPQRLGLNRNQRAPVPILF